MLRTQLAATHYYQRPDDGLPLDSAATRMTGDALTVQAGKIGGGTLRFAGYFAMVTPGLEVNDAGFLPQSDQRYMELQLGWVARRPTPLYRQARLFAFTSSQWTANGMLVDRMFNVNGLLVLPANWTITGGATMGQLPGALCDRCTRGGPALGESRRFAVDFNMQGDARRRFTPLLGFFGARDDEGRAQTARVAPALNWQAASNLQFSLGTTFVYNRDASQFYTQAGATGADTTHYVFALLRQHTSSLSLRVDYTIRPTVTLQAYAQPFASWGTYADLRELRDARAVSYAARYQPWTCPPTATCAPGLDFRQFRANTVLRWEYRPGSVLYLVWTQGRDDLLPAQGDGGAGTHLRRLFALPPANTLLIKVSYWLSA